VTLLRFDSPAGKQQKGVVADKTPSLPLFVVGFIVPTTHDMISQLLDPREPKNLSDVIVLAILAFHILAAYYLPWSLKRPVFAAIFLFWRASYNVGIGYLLTVQSKYRLLVTWAKRWKLFENPSTGENPRPWMYKILKVELETKIPDDYKFAEAPIEYNTWLLFRRVVDLILMCDFVSYCLFAIVCGHKPEGEALGVTVARWVLGVCLVGFNLWVKLDAHRVVKDYAWYWGGKSTEHLNTDPIPTHRLQIFSTLLSNSSPSMACLRWHRIPCIPLAMPATTASQ